MFGSLSTVIIDEVHAFAPTKRGDLLNLALSRLERFRPGFRRVALSATVQDPAAYVHWLAPADKQDSVRLVMGEKGADPQVTILIPEGRRSEEHTSELQSLMHISYAVFCLKKKKNIHNYMIHR